MRFRLHARNSFCWKSLAVSAFLLGAVWGCSGESTEQSQTSCDGDDDCKVSEVCVANGCENVCWNVTVGDGAEGDLCRQSSDCDSHWCDRSSRVKSTCECYSCPGVGGPEASPVVWEEVYTCIDYDDECFGERVRATFEVTGIYSSDIRAVIVDGPDTGFELSGYVSPPDFAYLCETEFKWEQQNVTDRPEEGCWTFNADQTLFYKHSYRPSLSINFAEWRCVGAASRGLGSTPPQVVTCEQLAAQVERDFRSCPESPR